MASELKAPRTKTVKRLFALSSNQCAFPGCTTAVADTKSEVVLCEIAHIAARRSGGPRHDKNQTAEERHGFENLILLCGTHHKEIDDNHQAYDRPTLLRMKADHEALWESGLESVGDVDDIADALLSKYWASVSVEVHQTCPKSRCPACVRTVRTTTWSKFASIAPTGRREISSTRTAAPGPTTALRRLPGASLPPPLPHRPRSGAPRAPLP
jgi:hypothetical protein